MYRGESYIYSNQNRKGNALLVVQSTIRSTAGVCDIRPHSLAERGVAT